MSGDVPYSGLRLHRGQEKDDGSLQIVTERDIEAEFTLANRRLVRLKHAVHTLFLCDDTAP
jgi:hypothetical protein